MHNTPRLSVFCLWSLQENPFGSQSAIIDLLALLKRYKCEYSYSSVLVICQHQFPPNLTNLTFIRRVIKHDIHIQVCAGCELFIESFWAVLLTCYSAMLALASSFISIPKSWNIWRQHKRLSKHKCFLHLWQKWKRVSGFGNRMCGFNGHLLHHFHQEAHNQCS